ncbi:hypothetical protein [Roseibium sp.]|uniref:hypothetical protein n=1 Tax=Roseibium sp. TaxID=1936156 RepID=UPI003516CE0B
MTDTADHGSDRYAGSSMQELAGRFDQLATGRIQRPKVPVTSIFGEAKVGKIRADYQHSLSDTAGPLFMHFLASIPCIQEELARVGCALACWATQKYAATGAPLTYFEMDAFDGTQARTLASLAGPAVRTLTCSPNPSNKAYFDLEAQPGISRHLQCSLFDVEVPPPGRDGGFDVIYEMAAFQFYGPQRRKQISQAAAHLAPGGVALFLDKMNQSDPADYDRRETAKDTRFKTRYFTVEEIEWKTRNFLKDMANG